MSEFSYLTSLIAGGVAGMVVDTTLFPLDTIRTRLQSSQGFLKSGGFNGLYKGIRPAFMGSVPTAALFFCTYDFTKNNLSSHNNQMLIHMTAATCAEVVSCLVKVPIEILKQRQQVGFHSSILIACNAICKAEGITGFYRGLTSTIFREVPFSVIQFPLWEMFKVKTEKWKKKPITVTEKALCGALAGGIAAGLTTPIDVAKTRIMLSETKSTNLRIHNMLRSIYNQKGLKGLFAGFVPRVLWITLGGAVFFGSYELCKEICNVTLKNVASKA